MEIVESFLFRVKYEPELSNFGKLEFESSSGLFGILYS